jgi:hypothetical protein
VYAVARKRGSPQESDEVAILRGFLETRIWSSAPHHHHILRQNGHNCGFAVEMTRSGNRGKVLPPTFPRFPPRLEIPQKTRDSHIPTVTTTAGLLSPQNRTPKTQKPNPSKIEGPVTFSRKAVSKGPLLSRTLVCIVPTSLGFHRRNCSLPPLVRSRRKQTQAQPYLECQF